MKRFILFLITTTLTTAASFAQQSDYKINVADFSELTVVDGVNVDYHCNPDSAGWVVFSCEPKLASSITFNNKGGRLTIQSDADEEPIKGLPRVHVYSAELTKLENSGDSLVRVFANKENCIKNFKARQIGNGSIEVYNINATSSYFGITAGKGCLHVEGVSEKATLSNVSTGPIDASGLKATQVKCLIFGTGDVDCTPAEQLRVFGAGSGKVYYHNKPEKIANRSIGVKAYINGEGPRATKAAK